MSTHVEVVGALAVDDCGGVEVEVGRYVDLVERVSDRGRARCVAGARRVGPTAARRVRRARRVWGVRRMRHLQAGNVLYFVYGR